MIILQQIAEKLQFILQDENLNNEASPDLHESIFMKPEKLHLTFGVMCLAGDDRRQRAEQLLVHCLETIVK